ncbi:MAG: methionine synthase [Alphaproteobacteria bacterium]|nr:methionine synthase [Alphaproteobacteria bacterium]
MPEGPRRHANPAAGGGARDAVRLLQSRPDSVFLDALDERVLIFDGAMGTMLHAADLPLSDYRGLENCSEVLIDTRPDVVVDIHRAYLSVGCDVVETNTFGGSAVVLAEFGLAEHARRLNRRAAELAREACAAFSTEAQPRFVAGSIGPGTRLPSLGHITWDELEAAYVEQVEGLVDGAVDVLLVETCQDILQTKCALSAIRTVLVRRGVRLPVMAQVTMEATGTMLVGTEIGAANVVLDGFEFVDVVGLNCATGPQEMAGHVAYLGRHARKRISVLPNAGLPQMVDGHTHYPLTPAQLADWHTRFVREDGVNVVGGCCGTGPDHIRAVVEAVRPLKPRPRAPSFTPALASLYAPVPLRQDADILAIGERTNANGSRRFKRMLDAEDWDGIVTMGRRQVKGGSHAIDVCTAFVGRDEVSDMQQVVSRLRGSVQAPLVIDSTELPVIEDALKLIGGRAVINSINLEDGEEKCDRLCPLARRHNAAVIALTIDEEGMAKTPERKLAVAERLYDIAVNRHGMSPHDILFDPLTFTICTGNEDDRKLGLWTLEGIERIAERFPHCGIVLGLSNISFGVNAHARHVLNSVFLYHARQRGVTAAIVHATKITPLHRIPEAQRQVAEDLIFDRRAPGYDPLARLLELFADASAAQVERPPPANVEERLKQRIIDGERPGLEADLDEAMTRHEPLAIINEILLDGMRVVGDLFGSGQMQLPFVLQSAETMKAAVAHLEPHMEKADAASRGRMILATVRGDVHDIGKNLVDIILSNNGYEVVNLGIKQPLESILAAYREQGADCIGMSGLLVKSTVIMRENLEDMRRQGVDVPVILGGAALTRSFVEQDCSRSYGRPVAYGKDAFAGLGFMDSLAEARAEGVPSKWQQPLDPALDEGRAQAESVFHAERPRRPLPEHELEAGPVPRVTPPTPPFWGSRVLERVPLRAVVPLLNEDVLFKFQWGFLRKGLSREEHAEQLRTVVHPILVDLLRRVEDEEIFNLQAAYGWFRCRPDGDVIELEDGTRLHFPRQAGGGRCITDYLNPDGDVLGLMAVTIGQRASDVARAWFERDAYRDYLYLHGLGVETAEALAEFVHRQMRAELGIAGDDPRDIRDLFRAKYRGVRYAYGYPACPEMADQRHLLRLVGAERIGITMDEDEQLHPEQSTAAIVLHHPSARYFRV